MKKLLFILIITFISVPTSFAQIHKDLNIINGVEYYGVGLEVSNNQWIKPNVTLYSGWDVRGTIGVSLYPVYLDVEIFNFMNFSIEPFYSTQLGCKFYDFSSFNFYEYGIKINTIERLSFKLSNKLNVSIVIRL